MIPLPASQNPIWHIIQARRPNLAGYGYPLRSAHASHIFLRFGRVPFNSFRFCLADTEFWAPGRDGAQQFGVPLPRIYVFFDVETRVPLSSWVAVRGARKVPVSVRHLSPSGPRCPVVPPAFEIDDIIPASDPSQFLTFITSPTVALLLSRSPSRSGCAL